MLLSVKSTVYQPIFGSRNNPIKPFEINTSLGKLFVTELKAEDCTRPTISHFVKMNVDNLIDGSTNPRWKDCADPSHRKEYGERFKQVFDFIKDLFNNDDGNSTILVAKDKQGNMKAGIIALGFDEIKGFEDPKTGYIASIIVDKQYRSNNVGKILIDKIIGASKGVFTDIVLTAYNKAVNFYKRIGFEEPNIEDPQIEAVLNIIKKERDDIPEYVTFMCKPLEDNSVRWWERFFQKIDNT